MRFTPHPLCPFLDTWPCFKMGAPLALTIAVLAAYTSMDARLPPAATYGGIEYAPNAPALQALLDSLSPQQWAVLGWSVGLHFFQSCFYCLALSITCAFGASRLRGRWPKLGLTGDAMTWLQPVAMGCYVVQHSCIFAQLVRGRAQAPLPQVTNAMSIMFLSILVPSVIFSLFAFAVSVFHLRNVRLQALPLTGPAAAETTKSIFSPHPFCDFLSTNAKLKICVALVPSIAFLLAYSILDNFLPNNATYAQIETQSTAADLQSKFLVLSSPQFAIVGFGAGLHVFNAVAFASSVLLGCTLMAEKLRDSRPRIAKLGDALAWAQPLATCFYWIEHSCLFAQLVTGTAVDPLPSLTVAMGVLFFSVLIPGIIYILVTTCMIIWCKLPTTNASSHN